MNVTRTQILQRGLLNRCPNCGGRTLFRQGRLFELNRECPQCGLKLERDEGFFLGSLSLNYGVTLVGFLTPVLLLWYFKVLGDTAAAGLAIVGALGFPVLFYRSSRSWWLMCYYYFLPHHLPANQGRATAGEDQNT
ncbi:MAG: hypothetical protein RLZZ129_12 [Verrucomicrobiota bacterium]|jgi:uncharacterized protein (DUF983 family)|nr:DUF983 domain-containing protein [Opitutaceae bacterium]HRJ47574.1 DUF983 domain-containing protein [Opitutaceae bacterium]